MHSQQELNDALETEPWENGKAPKKYDTKVILDEIFEFDSTFLLR